MEHPRTRDKDRSSGVVLSPKNELGRNLMSSVSTYLPGRDIINVPATKLLLVRYTVCRGLEASDEVNVM